MHVPIYNKYKINAGILLLALCLPGITNAVEFQSSDHASVMVEVYTSEGCSSCPPAENYLNNLLADPRLWITLFPMAFHVDYWDYLGWKDRFSKAKYSQRQRAYAKHYKSKTVYTPAFFVNARNWQPVGYNSLLPVADIDHQGILSVSVSDASIKARYIADLNEAGPYVLNIVVLGMGLHSEIKNGENAGRLAKHEFVVLDYIHRTGHQSEWYFNLPEILSQGELHRAVVAWVSNNDNPRPLQITGGLLEDRIQPGHRDQNKPNRHDATGTHVISRADIHPNP